MKVTKTSSQTSLIRIANYWVRPTFAAACAAALVSLASSLSLHATVLDNFTGTTPTGWTTTLNGGTIAQSGVYTITTGTSSGNLTYGLKTGSPFSVAPSVELEFRVDVTSVTSGGTSPQKILGWVPTGGALLANGYCVAVSETALAVYKDATVLTNVTGLTLPNNNLTIALRMSGSGGTVKINARVYQTISPGVIGLYGTCLAETTVVDSSGEFVAGSAALGVKSQSAGAASVAYDNLLVFNTSTVVLDSFSGGSLDTTKWTVFRKNSSLGDSVTVGGGVLDCKATLADAAGGFAGVYTKANVYSLVDGGKVEFQVDMVNNPAGANSYSAIGYLPIPATPYIYGLVEYHTAHDLTSTTVTLSGKCYNEWWGGNNVQPPTTTPGVRYTMTMTAENGAAPAGVCRIESRIEDLSVADVNDPARVVWQTEFIDTAAADPGLNETSSGTLYPYTATYNPYYGGGMSPRFALSVFNSGLVYPAFAEVTFANAVVRQTAAPPSPPIIANLVPNAFGSNFMSTSALVAFDVTDAANLDATKVTATLNGVTYKNGDTGVTITGGGTPSVHFSLAGVLTPNVNYVATFQATNSLGLTASVGLLFDTFLSSDFAIECEDYNFTVTDQSTYTNVAQYINNPTLQPDGFNDPTAYNTRVGFPEVDFHDNRGTVYDPAGIFDANHTFRYDYPYNAHSVDFTRAAYVTAGVPESDVIDINNGDWMNYTRTFPSGTFNVFLREDVYKLQNALVTLERVSNPAATAPQTTAVLGSFTGLPTGLGLYENVTLNDGTGNPMILRLGGLDTLQLNERVTGNASLNSGFLAQNYLVFVPVADPGTLRPVISMVSPLANTLLTSAAGTVTATIANRDTTVVVGTIGVKINGTTVASTAYATNGGAFVFANIPAPLPPPGTIITNTVYYQDSGGIYQTGVWTFTAAYPYLASSSGLPSGSLTIKGFDARMVQSAAADTALNNSVATARTYMEQPMPYTVDLTSTNIAQVVAWDLTLPGSYGATANFPGLCNPPANGNGFCHEIFAYLDLTAGAHFFTVDSDDAVGIFSGPSLRSDSITLVENDGVTHAAFSLVAATAGLYPLHILYQEGGGSAYLNLKCTDTGTPIIVNTAGAPAAYYPFVVKSSSSPLKGTYVSDPAANAGNVMTTANVLCDGTGAALTQTMTGGTITFPLPSSPKYYLIDGPRPTKITSVKKVGMNLVIQYTGQ